MNDWDKILKDFARKCKGGAPDMTNSRHLALLRESLLRFGWNENAANEIVGNLREGKAKRPGEIWQNNSNKKNGTFSAKRISDEKIGSNLKDIEQAKLYVAGKFSPGEEKMSSKVGKKGKARVEREARENDRNEAFQKMKKACEVPGPDGKESKECIAAKKEFEKADKDWKKAKEKEKSKDKSERKPGDPVDVTASPQDQVKQAKENLDRTEKLLKSKEDKKTAACEADENSKSCREATAEHKTAEKARDNAKYQHGQLVKIEKVLGMKDGEVDKDGKTKGDLLTELIQESSGRVQKDGFAQPGGISASIGESSSTDAANDIAKDYGKHELLSELEPPSNSDEEKKADSLSYDKKTEYGIELGLVRLSGEDEDNPPGYKPSQKHIDRAKEAMDIACPVPRPEAPDTPECKAAKEKWNKAKDDWTRVQKETQRELIRRDRWVSTKRKEILDGNNEVATKILDKCPMKDGDVDTSQKLSKSCKDALKTLNDWIETAYDTGRASIEEVRNDPASGAGPDFPNDQPDGLPQSGIMSPENQALMRGMLEEEKRKALLKCEALENEYDRTECIDTKTKHYDGELKNFDEGMSDHDTGMVYYDKNGNLRFVNISNKKTKLKGKKGSAVSGVPEDRSEGSSAADPHYNGTPTGRIETLAEAIDVASEDKDFQKRFPGWDNYKDEVETHLTKSIKAAFEIAENGKAPLIKLGNNGEVKDENGQVIHEIDHENKPPDGNPSQDAESMAESVDFLPVQGRKYFDDTKDHLKKNGGDAELEAMFGPKPEGGWTDAHWMALAIKVQKEGKLPNGRAVPYTPYGKLAEKFGDMHKAASRGEYPEGLPPEKRAEWDEKREGVDKNPLFKAFGELKRKREASLEEAHREIADGIRKQDEQWTKDHPEEAEAAGIPPANGPNAEIYVRDFMRNMHWDKYIMNLDGKKQVQIGGVNCRPEDFRGCLAELSGFTGEIDSEEGRKALMDHVAKYMNLTGDSEEVKMKGTDTNEDGKIDEKERGEQLKKEEALRKIKVKLDKAAKILGEAKNEKPKDKDKINSAQANYNKILKVYNKLKKEAGPVIGSDTWRTAGTSPKTAGGLGPDLIGCLRKKTNNRKADEADKKRKPK